MDSLKADDVQRAMATPPGEKGRQALAAMRLGIDLKLRMLRESDPTATEETLRARLWSWLAEER